MQGVSSFSLGFYPNLKLALGLQRTFLFRFYRSQFWRLQKPGANQLSNQSGFIGHNFGDYKNLYDLATYHGYVLSVTILETTKTRIIFYTNLIQFYRSQFWRLQKPVQYPADDVTGFIGHNFGDYKNEQQHLIQVIQGFIGHNFGDYKNLKWYQLITP